MHCPDCNSSNITEQIQVDTFQYGADHDPPKGGVVQLQVRVPVMECHDCRFEWTDYRAEEIRAAAVKEHCEKAEG